MRSKMQKREEAITQGVVIVKEHSLFRWMHEWYVHIGEMKDPFHHATISKWGVITCNKKSDLNPQEWAYVIAHGILHLALGHFNIKKHGIHNVDLNVWNQACDICVTRFLHDIKFVGSIFEKDMTGFPIKSNNEVEIYQYLMEHQEVRKEWKFSVSTSLDMLHVKDKKHHYYTEEEWSTKLENDFIDAIHKASKEAIAPDMSKMQQIKEWFVSHYPLFGALAASFEIVCDKNTCDSYDIKVAAINMEEKRIYLNVGMQLSDEEWKFVMAHEFLHAGLNHDIRQKHRDFFLWNVACDYVINDWLHEMQIGKMPQIGILYASCFHNMSAEEIYDVIVSKIKKKHQFTTLCGLNIGDILHRRNGIDTGIHEFYRDALKHGLDYHMEHHRGYLPAGLIEEINALVMPAIPWEIELATWLDHFIPDHAKYRTFARLSRRQAATPDIIRPTYQQTYTGKTFGVIIDTSGSMSSLDIGKALGSVVSYAISKEVSAIRLVFCDAKAYDQGYVNPNEIAGRVEVKGRGGTVIQPAVDLLHKARDFPSDAPVLIISDGYIESNLTIKFEHAFLLPVGARLPFKNKGEVFYYQ